MNVSLLMEKKNGTEKFYEDGKVRYLTEYKDDKRHGVYKSWKNGNLFMETNFKNDVYDGFSKVFNYKWTDYGEKIGDLVSIGDFKNGKKMVYG